MFELHIEQGPILENEHKMIGIVQGVQGMRWYEVTVTGQEAHTGAAPMRLRKNALLGAARMIERIDAIALEHAPDAVGAVGLIENKPNSRNVVPGEVFFTSRFRHPDDKVLDAMEQKLSASLAEILTPLQAHLRGKAHLDSPAVKFAPELIECVRVGTQKAGFKSRDMISGAGHDAAYIARVAPTTMIFVPCAGGISHNEARVPASTNAPPARKSCSTPCWSLIEGWGDLVGCAVRANLSSPPLRGRARERRYESALPRKSTPLPTAFAVNSPSRGEVKNRPHPPKELTGYTTRSISFHTLYLSGGSMV